jgi:hypothetical protein
MMKKLAVTVFALSLAAIGCGSDSGGKPDAGKTDGPPGAEVQVVPDAPVQPDVVQPAVETGQPDKPAVEVNAPDAPAIDQSMDMPAVDGTSPVIDGGIDAPAIDGGAVDTAKTEAGTGVDGGTGVDSQKVG